MKHQRRVRLPALNIIAAVQAVSEMVQQAGAAKRVLHFTDRTIGDHAHRDAYRIQQRLGSGNHLQFAIKQASDLRTVNWLQRRFLQVNAMLNVDGVDNFVQLHPFEALKNLGKVQRNAEFLEHVNVGAGANHLTVDQCAVTVKKYCFWLSHSLSVLTSLTFSSCPMPRRNRCRISKINEKNYHTTAPGAVIWYRIASNFPSLRSETDNESTTNQPVFWPGSAGARI